MMAPTEILAAQHYESLSNLLAPCGIKTVLITGSMRAKAKREAIKGLKTGEIQLAVGTHALISDGVEFSSLALVITDEQHRFGVNQRTALAKKGNFPHTLVMSATPIPRTLALMIYGDLDVSVLNELPPGRQPIETYLIDPPKRRRAFGYIKKHIDEGRQAYIVCPLIEEGESDAASIAAYEKIVRDYFGDMPIGILHGKMKPKEKDAVMTDFAENRTKLLLSTTVVEVGVDVPNAVIMMIEDADRLGLAQLHQLRGRVGRGKYASTCILVTEAQNDETLQRLRLFCSTTDGFKVADEDLRLRGAGNILGEVQSGHMGRVGLDLYLEMLEEAVARLKGTPVTQDVETELNLGLPAHIPQSYIEDGRERLRCYKALTSATSGAAREEVALSMLDRFGSFPQELVNFIAVLDFKQFLSHLQVQRADIYLDHVRLVWGDGQTAVQPERILQLVASMKGARMLPPASLMLPLPADKDFAQGLQGLRQALENIRTPEAPGGTA